MKQTDQWHRVHHGNNWRGFGRHRRTYYPRAQRFEQARAMEQPVSAPYDPPKPAQVDLSNQYEHLLSNSIEAQHACIDLMVQLNNTEREERLLPSEIRGNASASVLDSLRHSQRYLMTVLQNL